MKIQLEDPAAAVAEIVRERRLRRHFNQRIRAECERWENEPAIRDPGLEDLCDRPFVTIDNASSRDLDQAVFVARQETGYAVDYAIADASHFVRPGSALFAEALRRGATFYLPGLAVTMLPRVLSEGLVSLNPRVQRRALVFRMELDERGQCRRTHVVRARIRSRAKLSFDRVQRLYDDPHGSSLRSAPYRSSLELLREVGEMRLERAHRRGVLEYHRRELELKLADHSIGVELRRRSPVERYNEQISLLCNIEGARLLKQRRGAEWVQAVFRVHPDPDPGRRQRLEEQLRSLAELRGLDAERWIWRPRAGQSLAAYLDGLGAGGGSNALRRAVERQVLLANQRSLFSDQPGPHFGVGAPVYARLSAPMREIAGVFTHKELLESLGDAASAPPSTRDVVLRERVIESANRARWVQADLDKRMHAVVLAALLQPELARSKEQRTSFHGVVLGMKPSHVYVELDNPPLELKLYLSDLEGELGAALHTDEALICVRSRSSGEALLCLGDRLALRVEGRAPESGRWSFQLLHRTAPVVC